jgi:hypothetical protein
MIRRAFVAALAAVLAAGAAASVQAAPADYLLPVEKHTTPKAQALAVKYRPQLLQFSEYVYHCLPYVEIRNGLGFKKNAKDRATDDRFAALWIYVEQGEDKSFATLSPARQASAIFSRYGVPILRRLAAMQGLASDPDVYGFSVAVAWVKPGSDPNQPTLETLATFMDQKTTRAFLSNTLSASEWVDKMKIYFFDGEKEMGRLPLEVWEDNFIATYKVPNYEVQKGVTCP